MQTRSRQPKILKKKPQTKDKGKELYLIIAETDEDNVAGGDPDLLMHLPPDVTGAFDAIEEAGGLASAVSEHTQDLSVLLSVFLEDQFSLLVVGFVLRHRGGASKKP